MTEKTTTPDELGASSCSEITSIEKLIAAIHATEGNGDMVSGTFGPTCFHGKIVSPNDKIQP